jgi:hypothetical protein
VAGCPLDGERELSPDVCVFAAAASTPNLVFMGTQSETYLLVMLALRLKGFGEVEVVASVHGLELDATSAVLAELTDAEFVQGREVDGSMKYVLTSEGRARGAELLSEELDDSGNRGQLEKAYGDFLDLNVEMLTLCTDWQIVGHGSDDQRINDHTDEDYDQDVIGRLADLDGRLRKVLAPMRATLARFDGYPDRFRSALDRLLDGELDYFTKPILPSYHTVWFELHEDLLATLSIDRASEGST